MSWFAVRKRKARQQQEAVEVIGYLEEMPKLRELCFYDSPITDAGLDRLKVLTQLKILKLRNTHVTEEGAMKLREALPNCEIDRRQVHFPD